MNRRIAAWMSYLTAFCRNMLWDAKAQSLYGWNPLHGAWGKLKLKNGAQYGTLVKFLNGGRILRVLPEGYKQPQDYHPALWEPLA